MNRGKLRVRMIGCFFRRRIRVAEESNNIMSLVCHLEILIIVITSQQINSIFLLTIKTYIESVLTRLKLNANKIGLSYGSLI
jgi:hypothetical protein